MTRTVAYDPVLLRPGCALVQRALGATIPHHELDQLNAWLSAPTDDMRVYETSDEQLAQIITVTNTRHPSPTASGQ